VLKKNHLENSKRGSKRIEVITQGKKMESPDDNTNMVELLRGGKRKASSTGRI